ncbi:hemerythrin domain-containing protein [candidate division WOR-3 bacterium]|nr:hemerythrin domain-containing protein [candidate division WOR-3 bacterium]
MMPIGPLMIEHRLIEKLVGLIPPKLELFRTAGAPDLAFIDDAVRFIRDYADRTHHGKEEDILFRELAKKPLSAEHRRVMDELVEEHKLGRKTVAALVAARDRYAAGDRGALADIIEPLEFLAGFYPKHIEKEDRHFFIPVMSYFTAAEKDALLAESYEFDRKLVHEFYGRVVERWQKHGT